MEMISHHMHLSPLYVREGDYTRWLQQGVRVKGAASENSAYHMYVLQIVPLNPWLLFSF